MNDDKKISGKRRRRCDICFKLKYGVHMSVDPYEQDINGIEIKQNICPQCYQNLSDDI
jgi:hypothetical protein